MEMFDNYKNIPASYIPDNRVRFVDTASKYKDTIVIGADCSHVLEFDFNFDSLIKSAIICYKQGLSVVLTKTLSDFEVDVINDNQSFITIHLSPEETRLFDGEHNRDTFAQLEFGLVEDSLIYSKLFKLKVINTIIPQPVL